MTKAGPLPGDPGVTIVRALAVLVGGALLGLAVAGLSILGFDAATEALEPGAGGPVLDALSVLEDAVVIGGLALGFAAVAALVFRRRLLSFLTLSPRFRWRLFAAGFIPFAGLQLAAVGFSVGFGAEHSPFSIYPGMLEAMIFCLAAMIFYAPSVLAEEVLFRSWILSEDTTLSGRNLIAVLVSSLVFSAAHLQSDPLLMLLHVMSGAAYAWAAVRLGGVEFSLGAHLAKNTVLAAMLGLPGQHRWGDEFAIAVTINIAASVVLVAIVEIIRASRTWWNRGQGHAER